MQEVGRRRMPKPRGVGERVIFWGSFTIKSTFICLFIRTDAQPSFHATYKSSTELNDIDVFNLARSIWPWSTDQIKPKNISWTQRVCCSECVWLGATTRNGRSIPRSCNNARRAQSSAICRVARSPIWRDIKKHKKYLFS